jgi:flagellar assembly protein FliH
VLGELGEQANFIPDTFAEVKGREYSIDAMFADFGAQPEQVIELDKDRGDFDLQPAVESQLETAVAEASAKETHSSDREMAKRCDAPVDATREAAQRESLVEVSASDALPEAATASDVVADEVTQNEAAATEGGVQETLLEEPAADEKQSVIESQPELEAESEDEPEAEQSEQSNVSAPQFDEAKVAEALSQAYERGCSDTRKEIDQVQQQLEERYSLLWEDMQAQLDEALHINERKAVELALQIAKRLVGDVVQDRRDYIQQVISEAIKMTAGAEISTIRVSPSDYEFLKLQGYGDTKKFIAGEAISFTSDESIKAGCVLVTSAGEVDFDLDKAWERIRAKVLQEPEL